MYELEQIKLISLDYTLTMHDIVVASKIFIITLFLTCVFLIKGSLNNPFKALCGNTIIMRQINAFLVRAKFTIEWTLFTSMRYYSYDTRLTAITHCGVKYEWYIIRDGSNWMDGRFKVHLPYSRTVLSTHFFNLFKHFLGPYFIKITKEFCEEREQTVASLVVEQVSFYSMDPPDVLENRSNPLSITQTYTLI